MITVAIHANILRILTNVNQNKCEYFFFHMRVSCVSLDTRVYFHLAQVQCQEGERERKVNRGRNVESESNG